MSSRSFEYHPKKQKLLTTMKYYEILLTSINYVQNKSNTGTHTENGIQWNTHFSQSRSQRIPKNPKDMSKVTQVLKPPSHPKPLTFFSPVCSSSWPWANIDDWRCQKKGVAYRQLDLGCAMPSCSLLEPRRKKNAMPLEMQPPPKQSLEKRRLPRSLLGLSFFRLFFRSLANGHSLTSGHACDTPVLELHVHFSHHMANGNSIFKHYQANPYKVRHNPSIEKFQRPAHPVAHTAPL